jgi:predicted XRE-type DNA-binding protein
MERFLILNDTQTKMDEVKKQLCDAIYKEIITLRRSQKDIARRLGTTQSNISRVINRRVKYLTFGQLFRYLTVLNPNFQILISPY